MLWNNKLNYNSLKTMIINLTVIILIYLVLLLKLCGIVLDAAIKIIIQLQDLISVIKIVTFTYMYSSGFKPFCLRCN